MARKWLVRCRRPHGSPRYPECPATAAIASGCSDCSSSALIPPTNIDASACTCRTGRSRPNQPSPASCRRAGLGGPETRSMIAAPIRRRTRSATSGPSISSLSPRLPRPAKAEMPDQERVIEPEPPHGAMIARVGVQRLFLRCEGVEQRERGLAVDMLVVPRQQELDRDGDPFRRLDLRLVHEEPATEDGGGDPGFDRRQRYPDRGAQ